MTDDVQRELQQRALRNVRGLLDKLEDEAVAERRTRRLLGWALVFAGVLLFCAFMLLGRGDRGESRVIVSQPPPASFPPKPGPQAPR